MILLFRTRFRFFSSEDWGQVKPIPSVFLRISSLAHESLPDSTEEGTEEGTEDRCRLTSFLNVPPPEFVRVCPYPNSFVDDSLLALRLFFFRRLFFFFGIVTLPVLFDCREENVTPDPLGSNASWLHNQFHQSLRGSAKPATLALHLPSHQKQPLSNFIHTLKHRRLNRQS